MTKDMKDYTELNDDDLRLVLQRMDERDTPPLPQDLADRVMAKLQPPSSSPLKGEGYGRALLLPSGRLGGGRRKTLWAVAASIALIVAITLTLWPKPQETVYQDTFASAEEACLVLSNNTDNNTIAL
jgi:hypothetical protein